MEKSDQTKWWLILLLIVCVLGILIYKQPLQSDSMPENKGESMGDSSQSVIDSSAAAQCDHKNLPMLLTGVFTRQIVNDQAVENLHSLGVHQQELYFHSTIIGGMHKTISHRWLFNNQPVSEPSFSLRFDQFPIWSKQLLAGKRGTWEVQVWSQGCLLDRFNIAHNDNDNDEGQVVRVDKNNTWFKPKDVLDTIIIDSAKALIPAIGFKVEYWQRKNLDNRVTWKKIKDKSKFNQQDDLSSLILMGDIAKIKEAILNINRLNSQGETPFFEAIKYNQQDIALFLLANGSNPFMRSAEGVRPYNLAIKKGMALLTAAMLNYAEQEKLWIKAKNKRFSDHLINKIMDYQKWQHRNALGYTPLLFATTQDNDWAVAVLLQRQRKTGLKFTHLNPFMNDHLGKRADQIAKDNNNFFAAHLIEKYQRESKAPWMILESAISTGMKEGRPLDCVNKQPLVKSVTYYYYNRLMDTSTSSLSHKWFYQNKLVEVKKPNYGSDNNVLFSTHTLTELDKGYWRVELVDEQSDVLDRMQLAYGERYTADTSAENTPLSSPCLGSTRALTTLIAGWQNPKLIADLIDATDEFDPKEPKGFNTAVTSGNISSIRLFLDRGVDVNLPLHPRSRGYPIPALVLAVESGNFSVVKYLLHRGADINQHGMGYSTALYQSSVERNHQLLKLLLEHGADPSLLSYPDNLPLIKSANFCDINAMNLLVESGASFSQETKNGKTAQEIANRDCKHSSNWGKIKNLIEQEKTKKTKGSG